MDDSNMEKKIFNHLREQMKKAIIDLDEEYWFEIRQNVYAIPYSRNKFILYSPL